jgi:phosphoribosylpyrophosphate synthetase
MVRGSRLWARVIADLFEAEGIGHVVTVDVRTSQIEGFLHAPVRDSKT